MNGIFDIINVPIGMLLRLCYDLVQNYGVAILLFALITKLCLLPLGIKAEKGRRKMMKAQPRIQQLQQKYKNNTRDPKYQEEMQKIYSEEGYSPTSGCLPQLIQLPLILSLWTNIRQPLTYLLNMSALNIEKLFNAVTALGINYGEKVTYQTVNQLTLIRDINANSDALSGVIAETGYRGINLNFLGLNLGDTPQFAWTITDTRGSFVSCRNHRFSENKSDRFRGKSSRHERNALYHAAYHSFPRLFVPDRYLYLLDIHQYSHDNPDCASCKAH